MLEVVLTVSPVGLLDAAIVGNVLPLGVDTVQLHADLRGGVVSILPDDARRLVQKLLEGLRLPPVPEVAVGVVLPALVVEAVRDLVADDPPDAAVVEVGRPVLVEEDPLEDPGRELDGVLDGAVEGVDDGGVGVPLPVRLVHLLSKLLPVVVGGPDAHADAVLEVGRGLHFESLVELLQSRVVEDLLGIADVFLDGVQFAVGAFLCQRVHPRDLKKLNVHFSVSMMQALVKTPQVAIHRFLLFRFWKNAGKLATFCVTPTSANISQSLLLIATRGKMLH